MHGALPVLLWCSTLRRQQMCAHGGGEECRITTPPTNPAAHSVVISTSSACTLAKADDVPPFGIGDIGGSRPKFPGTIERARCQLNDGHGVNGVNGKASQCDHGEPYISVYSLEGAGVRCALTVQREFREDASFRPHLRAAPRIGNAPTSPCHLQRRTKDARRRFLHAEQASAVTSPKAYVGIDESKFLEGVGLASVFIAQASRVGAV
jgi:hypothetical protein